MSHIGIDLHGTITTNVEFFHNHLTDLIKNGNTISIISGSTSLKILKELNDMNFMKNVHYHNIYSVQDFLRIENGVHFTERFNQNKQEMGLYCNPELWDATKAILCNIHKIDVFIDNEITYLKYFGQSYYQNGGLTYLYTEFDRKDVSVLTAFLNNLNIKEVYNAF